jgi:hypothetical protein
MIPDSIKFKVVGEWIIGYYWERQGNRKVMKAVKIRYTAETLTPYEGIR